MSFQDFGSRYKSAQGITASVNAQNGAANGTAEGAAQAVAEAVAEAFVVRARMVGVLLRDARMHAGRSPEDCAARLQIAPDQIERWELGDETPTLPQLELLAYYLAVPVSHFWGMKTLTASTRDFASAQADFMLLRDRMIGALVRQAREAADLSIEELAGATGISAENIAACEAGEHALPMHELTVLADHLKKNLNYFLETSSHIGAMLALRELYQHFATLPEDLRQFAANPLNAGFIEIAKMLADMPTDRLRRVGESVLNITL